MKALNNIKTFCLSLALILLAALWILVGIKAVSFVLLSILILTLVPVVDLHRPYIQRMKYRQLFTRYRFGRKSS